MVKSDLPAYLKTERAINERTAVVYFVYDPQNGVLLVREVIQIAHEKGVPVIVDAAAELPPKENLTNFINIGPDLVSHTPNSTA